MHTAISHIPLFHVRLSGIQEREDKYSVKLDVVLCVLGITISAGIVNLLHDVISVMEDTIPVCVWDLVEELSHSRTLHLEKPPEEEPLPLLLPHTNSSSNSIYIHRCMCVLIHPFFYRQ